MQMQVDSVFKGNIMGNTFVNIINVRRVERVLLAKYCEVNALYFIQTYITAQIKIYIGYHYIKILYKND